jgi:ABC-type lipoprotein export system ATPase subunit
MSAPLALCDGAARTFGAGPSAVVALQPTDCAVAPGAQVALVGPSGSGKSTLLHLLAGLDRPTRGRVRWPGIGDALRPGLIAVVFQGPSLLPPLTALENVALPLALAGMGDIERRVAAVEALDRLELVDLAERLPEELSAGQAQRVAVARALAGSPRLILADEPTGQLDRGNAAVVVEALVAAAAHTGAGLMVATHDPAIASRLDERWDMHSGRLGTPVGGWA